MTTKTVIPPGQCVAEPRNTYRGADHMRCTHPTPTPPGYRRCRGENGCPFRLGRGDYCYYHARDLHTETEDKQRVRREWGGPKPLSSIWSM